MNALIHLWQTQKVAMLLMLLAILAMAFFGFRFIRVAVYFNDPAHIQQPLEPWMTPRYVGRSYRLPPEDVRAIMQLGPPEGHPPTMEEVTHDMGISMDEMEAMIRAASEARKAAMTGQ